MKFCGMIIVLLTVSIASVCGQQEPLTLEYASLVSHIPSYNAALLVYLSDVARTAGGFRTIRAFLLAGV